MIAVSGRAPAPVRGVRFVSRSIERRFLGLYSMEVALLEVLRVGPGLVEVSWTRVAEVGERLQEAGEIRAELMGEQVHNEHHIALRERWAELGLAESIAA